jgi:hypothetical protein
VFQNKSTEFVEPLFGNMEEAFGLVAALRGNGHDERGFTLVTPKPRKGDVSVRSERFWASSREEAKKGQIMRVSQLSPSAGARRRQCPWLRGSAIESGDSDVDSEVVGDAIERATTAMIEFTTTRGAC